MAETFTAVGGDGQVADVLQPAVCKAKDRLAGRISVDLSINAGLPPDLPHMTLSEYIERELRSVREARKPNALSVRFAQLHAQAGRTAEEEEEYQALLGLLRSRWQWSSRKADDGE